MKLRRDKWSPWGVRLWLEAHEFDSVMDGVRERAGKDIFSPSHGVDVEAILTRVYGIKPGYQALPANVLGRTLYHRDGRVEVELSRELSQRAQRSSLARHRLRSTLAHELGHVALHRDVCAPAKARTSYSTILCRSDALGAGEENDWWEYQANRAMGSVLMPREITSALVTSILRDRGRYPNLTEAMTAGRGVSTIRQLASVLDVSLTLAVLRLQDLGLLPRLRKR